MTKREKWRIYSASRRADPSKSRRDKEVQNAWRRADRKAHPEKWRTWRRKWNLANKDYWRRMQEKKREKIEYRILLQLRHRLNMTLRGANKSARTVQLLGCSIESFKIHLESFWETGMTWENYGKDVGQWSIDHVIPCSLFDLTKSDHQKRCFHFSNMRPMWAIDNIIKSDRFVGQMGLPL